MRQVSAYHHCPHGSRHSPRGKLEVGMFLPDRGDIEIRATQMFAEEYKGCSVRERCISGIVGGRVRKDEEGRGCRWICGGLRG